MPEGKVKRVVQDKGFGFFEVSGRPDVFFHHSTVAEGGFDNLAQGQQVEFELDGHGGSKGKGPRAASVRPI